MNCINTLFILIIIIFIINYLTNGKIVTLFTNYTSFYKNKIENFMGITYDNNKEVYSNTPIIPFANQLDFPYMNNNNNNDIFNLDTYNLYNFINTLITPNINIYELTSSNTDRILGDKNFHDKIINYIYTIFNSSYFIFSDIILLNKIYYYKNPRGKDIEIFKFNAIVYLNNGLNKRKIGNFIFSLELFIHEDKNYHKYNNFNKYSIYSTKNEYIAIINVKLLGNLLKKNNNFCEQKKKNIKNVIDINNKMNDSFNNYFVNRNKYNDLFIKPTNKIPDIINDTENSLIPSIINISQSYDEN